MNMRKTVLVLGAGASADFDIPLWGELRQQLSDLNVNELTDELELTEDEKSTHLKAFEEYLTWARSEPNFTLDRIIYEIDKPKEKHMNPTGHLVINIVGYLLAQLEQNISTGKWVTEFQDHLVDLVAKGVSSMPSSQAIDLLENFTVVSLNYDRIFEHFMTTGFFEKLVAHSTYQPSDLKQSKELATKTELKLYRPHGYICSLPNAHHNRGVGMGTGLGVTVSDAQGIRHPGNDTAVPFGDQNLLKKTNFLRMGKHMYVVNERGNTDYANANGALARATDIFCLGLSPDGIIQSSLVFNNNQNVYLSNKASDLSEISAKKGEANYITMNSDGSRLDAGDFTKRFAELSVENSKL